MHDDQPSTPASSAPDESGRAGSPIGSIDLGKAPSVGRRARLLAGITTTAAAAVLVTLSTPDTGTSHSGPLG